MAWKIRHIIFVLLVSRTLTGYAQDITIDTIETKGENLFLVFNSDALYHTSDANRPQPGDSFRVNYMNSSLSTSDADSRFVEGDNVIAIAKDSILKNSITSITDISITFLKQERDCWMKVTGIEFHQRGDTLALTSMLFLPQRITWERKHACENDPWPLVPLITENVSDVEFLSPWGLNIDRFSGVCIPSDQTAGIYPVNYRSTFCLEKNSDTILIHPAPSFTIERHRRLCEGRTIELSPSAVSENDAYTWSDGATSKNLTVSKPGTYTVMAENEFGCRCTDTVEVELKTIQIKQIVPDITPADCYQEGSVSFSLLEIQNGELPYSYRYENSVTRQVFSNPGSLREGDYTLTIKDADGCVVAAPERISVRKDCLSDHPVFTPNTDGMDDDYFIPYEGEAVVYDRNGTERHKFMAPAYWDGKDGSGNPLPMGTYLIVVGNKEVINITIIK
jgi:hypothetical protein